MFRKSESKDFPNANELKYPDYKKTEEVEIPPSDITNQFKATPN